VCVYVFVCVCDTTMGRMRLTVTLLHISAGGKESRVLKASGWGGWGGRKKRHSEETLISDKETSVLSLTLADTCVCVCVCMCVCVCVCVCVMMGEESESQEREEEIE